MSHCDGQKDGINEAVRDALKDWITRPEVQHRLNTNRCKLIAKGILIKIRDK